MHPNIYTQLAIIGLCPPNIKRLQRVREYDVIIIDEVSMVCNETLILINYILRKAT